MWLAKQVARRSQRSDWRSYFLIACVGLLAILLAGASLSAMRSAKERGIAEQWQVHTLEVLIETDRLRTASLSKLRGERGFLLTDDERFLEPYFQGVAQGETSLARLVTLTADNPEQLLRIDALERELTSFDTRLQELLALQRSGRKADAIASVKQGEGKTSLDRILSVLDAIERTERRLLAERTLKARQLAVANERYQYVLTAIGVLLLALTVVATIYVRQALDAEADARRALQRSASTDALTGLPNRRSFIDALERLLERAATDPARPLSLAIFDIDHFKQINDRFGHPAGDGVIREVARRAGESLRKRDLVGRIGGEEFAVIFPRADLETAAMVCERLRHGIADRPVVHGDAIIPFTVSVGVAAFQPGDDLDHLLARADAALYEAKTGGRNQVRRAV
ncbi:sensor domain-containing diguanylate cyclase [Qipengyuania mesophila]|uniref:sensor domain-containing diguanylate cyclase n=1 Tax=Qipengyuania mesophila TaxID=2867246 RepID=UPI0035189105